MTKLVPLAKKRFIRISFATTMDICIGMDKTARKLRISKQELFHRAMDYVIRHPEVVSDPQTEETPQPPPLPVPERRRNALIELAPEPKPRALVCPKCSIIVALSIRQSWTNKADTYQCAECGWSGTDPVRK